MENVEQVYVDRFTLREMKILLKGIVEQSKAFNSARWNETRKDVLGQPVCKWDGSPCPDNHDYSHLWIGPGDAVRHVLLAYGIMRGVPYLAMESKTRFTPNLGLVLSVIKKFSPKDVSDRWDFERLVREIVPVIVTDESQDE